MQGEVHKLRVEKDTDRPPPGDPPRLCAGLEINNMELGFIRENLEWQAECLKAIASKLGVRLPKPPVRHPGTRR